MKTVWFLIKVPVYYRYTVLLYSTVSTEILDVTRLPKALRTVPLLLYNCNTQYCTTVSVVLYSTVHDVCTGTTCTGKYEYYCTVLKYHIQVVHIVLYTNS